MFGDFRQTLPVIVKGIRANIVKLYLSVSNYGRDGKVPNFENKIEIDRDLGETVTSLEDLISKVYPYIVEIKIINGCVKGQYWRRETLARVAFLHIPSKLDFKSNFFANIIQFSVKLSFAVTINRSHLNT
ncbi:ATP-dependent DNA helicase [Aphis craccivora]|uniref:ATP-dependent DNA helicase n=1 Tax=Aphis craccivora TaxID=307492 RepID=A0A6G0Y4N9_APHCR|nr:ATP-dependent DNA helicase [Aphis craccivora]